MSARVIVSLSVSSLAATLDCGHDARKPTAIPPDRCDTIVVADTTLPSVQNAWTNSIALTSWARQRGAPTFEQFAVAPSYSGSVAPVNLNSARGARRYRTVLRYGASEGPNFADHFTVVWWGCGSPCTVVAILDAKTGLVVMLPDSYTRPPMFRRDSRLLVFDATGFLTDSEARPYFDDEAHYYEWVGDHMVLRYSLDPVRVRVTPSNYGVKEENLSFPPVEGGPPDIHCVSSAR